MQYIKSQVHSAWDEKDKVKLFLKSLIFHTTFLQWKIDMP